MRHGSNRLLPRLKLILFRFLIASLILLPAACTATPTPEPTPTPIPLAEELVFYDWDEDMPQSILDAFTAELILPCLRKVTNFSMKFGNVTQPLPSAIYA